MKNKTPIQELIDLLNKRGDELWKTLGTQSYEARCHLYDYRELTKTLLGKEKQFAFDCYQAGYSEAWEGGSRTIEEDFDLFYSQYAEQHTK